MIIISEEQRRPSGCGWQGSTGDDTDALVDPKKKKTRTWAFPELNRLIRSNGKKVIWRMRFDDDDVGFHQEEEHCVGGGWEQLDWLAGQTFANGVVSFFF